MGVIHLAEEKMHASVIEFKHFVNKHPALLKDIRKRGRSWQEHYEKWVLLGEEDSHWDEYREEDVQEEKEVEEKIKGKHSELFGQLIKLSENIDVNKLQSQVHQLNNTITTIQEVITQFQQTKKSPQSTRRPVNGMRD